MYSGFTVSSIDEHCTSYVHVYICRHYPRKYFDKRVRLRVYEKLSPEERIKYGCTLDSVVEGRTKKKLSKRSQIFDLLCDIIDPYYVIWMVGVVLSSPVRLCAMYPHSV